jgi:hypothetical protein
MRTLALSGLLLLACGPTYGAGLDSRGHQRPLEVHVANQRMQSGSGQGRGAWVNECVQVVRLGDGETRQEWLGRIERVVEDRHDQLASITYPPGDGLEIAMVCFSVPAI